MLDPDIPPVVEEEEADGAVGVARQIAEASPAAVIVSNTAVASPPPWTTSIGAPRAETIPVAAAVAAVDSLRHTLRLNPSRCRSYVKTRIRAYLLSSTTCSSKRKFRRRPANST